MASNLLVTLPAGGIIEHIHGFDDGILADYALDVQKRLLHMQFGIIADAPLDGLSDELFCEQPWKASSPSSPAASSNAGIR